MITKLYTQVRKAQVASKFYHYQGYDTEEIVYNVGDEIQVLAELEAKDFVDGRGYLVYDEELNLSFTVTASHIEVGEVKDLKLYFVRSTKDQHDQTFALIVSEDEKEAFKENAANIIPEFYNKTGHIDVLIEEVKILGYDIIPREKQDAETEM